MTGPMRMGDFFALEAGEYLDRLDVVCRDTPPNPDDLVRLSRALRGSALIASQAPIARAAQGLEALARALRDGRRAWDDAVRAAAARAVDDLRVFVRRTTHWSDDDTRQAEALAADLEQVAGGRVTIGRAVDRLDLDAGARAFVAREGAAIASALDRAASTLEVSPGAAEPLQAVLRAMQPLCGLAAIQELPPLPELFDGIERAVAEVKRAGLGAADAGPLFASAARAIVRACRDVASTGRPDPEAAEAREFAERLGSLIAANGEAVPIERLFYDDDGPHILERGQVKEPRPLETLDLVGHGEHLRQAADDLERAASRIQRELRAHTLSGVLRLLAEVGGTPLNEAVAAFARGARSAVAVGAIADRPTEFAAHLRTAGGILAQATSDETTAARDLETLAARLATLGPPRAAAAATSPPPAPAAPRASAPGLDLARGWQTFERLRARAATDAPADADVVPIETLLYRGEAAVQRILALKAVATGADAARRREALDEIFDLIGLALPRSG